MGRLEGMWWLDGKGKGGEGKTGPTGGARPGGGGRGGAGGQMGKGGARRGRIDGGPDGRVIHFDQH
jgi:hypothetical protein